MVKLPTKIQKQSNAMTEGKIKNQEKNETIIVANSYFIAIFVPK